MQDPALKVLTKIKLYIDSVDIFGPSPFIYPVYGLSGIPESFSRKSAVFGGVYMLNVEPTKLEKLEDGRYKITGTWEGESKTSFAKKIIAHPKYIQKLGLGDRLKKTSTCVRCICILDHPIPAIAKKEHKAVQIIMPQSHTKRKSNIYIMMIG